MKNITKKKNEKKRREKREGKKKKKKKQKQNEGASHRLVSRQGQANLFLFRPSISPHPSCLSLSSSVPNLSPSR